MSETCENQSRCGGNDSNCCRNERIRKATVRVGMVRTGAPGSCARVFNSGTCTDAVLNFTIPRGSDGASNTNTELGCSRAQMRNVLSQIIKCFEGCEVALTLFDGTRIPNLKLLAVCPDCNPIYVKVKDCTADKVRVLLIDSIAQVSVMTSNCIPEISFINCRRRFSNPIEDVLSCGVETELVLVGYNITRGVIKELKDGMVVSTNNCPESIDFTASDALIGFTILCEH